MSNEKCKTVKPFLNTTKMHLQKVAEDKGFPAVFPHP
jgi:hypothetical protein